MSFQIWPLPIKSNKLEKRSILFLVQLPPPVHGAALRNEFLAKSILLHNSFDIKVMRLDFAKSVKDVGAFSILKLMKMIGFSVRLFFKLLAKKPNLIYYNFAMRGIALYRDWFFVRIAKLFGVPLVLHLRTQGVKEQVAKSSLKLKLFKSALSSTTIVCLSEYLATDIETVYQEQPEIVANGIDMVVTDEAIHNKKENSVPVFLFLSNLTRSKGIFEFIDALKILHDKGLECRGKVTGPEYDVKISYLEQYIIDSGLEGIVEITGPVYGDDKFQKFLDSDVFVFPTWFEAFPGVVLEAMQSGLPVISTMEGAIPEIVDNGNTGFLVVQKDVESLAEKMEILAKDRGLRDKLGAAGRIKFKELYTSATFEQEMKKVFESALIAR